MNKQYINNKIRAKTLNKLQTFRQGTWNFRNFIDEFKRFILETGKILDNKIKKALYKKALKKKLALISMDIDSNTSFEIYKIQLITINDYLM